MTLRNWLDRTSTASAGLALRAGTLLSLLLLAASAGAAPPNDNCTNATIIGLNTPIAGTTLGATTEPGSGAQCANSSLDVYYRFIAPASDNYSISLCASPTNWDTVLSVHEPFCIATPLTQIADGCNDDGCFSVFGLSVIPSVAMTAGSDYIIRVAGFGTANLNSNDFVLVVGSATAEPLGACCQPGLTICIVGPQNACPQPGGRWLAGFICSPNPCQQSIGACCDPATSTCVLSTQTNCFLPRVFFGDGSSCPAGPCDALGACCLATQTCQLSTPAQCAVFGGIFLGPGSSCLSCPPVGACCCGTRCTISGAGDCTDPNEYYLGDNTTCTPASCPSFPPTNSLCDHAAELLSDGLVNGTNVGAPLSAATTCGGGDDLRGVWYRLSPPVPGIYRLRTLTGGTLLDTTLAVYAACNGPQLGCNDDVPGGGSRLSRLDLALHPGNTYFIRIAGYLGATGTFALECSLLTPTPEPTNDACIDAALVADGTIPFTVRGATPDAVSGCATVIRDVWLRYIPAQAGVVTVSNCVLDDANTMLSVHLACGAAPIVCAQQNCGGQAQLSFPAAAGTPYLIRVGDLGGGTPEGSLTISCPQCAPTAPFGNCIECPDCAAREPEPCGANTNGGCSLSSDCPVSAIALGQHVCGTAWADGGFADLDVFEFLVPAACEVSLCGSAQFPIRLSIISATCPATVFNTVDGPACEDTCVSAYLTPGTYRVAITPSVTTGHPCGTANDYSISLECGCDDEQAMYDSMGQLILPADMETPQTVPPDEYVNMDMGEVGSLYPQFDTEADDWYDCYPCNPSIGGELPPEADQATITTLMASEGIDMGGLTPEQMVEALEDFGARIAGLDNAANKLATSPSPVGNYVPPATPRQLNPESCDPFQGRDIVLVFGFYQDPIVQKGLMPSSPPPEWPAVLTPAGIAPFYTGVYHADALAYWNKHLRHFLLGRGYQNRVLLVSYPMTQRADVAAECILHQIADAMSNRNNAQVYSIAGPNLAPVSVSDFGTPSFVCISHSTGSLVTDIAMSAARHVAGVNAGYVADHCKAHIALHGAFCGSQYATPVVVGSFFSPYPNWVCNLAVKVIEKFTSLSPPSSPLTCTDINNLAVAIRGSIMVDLVPAVAQLKWGWYCNFTPVRTLMIAGGHPSSIRPLKYLFAKGYDDGVLNLNSQTALFTPSLLWPSGFVPKPPPPPLPQLKAWRVVFDMGVFFPGTTATPGLDAKWRAVGLFLDQVIDPLIKLIRFPGLVAAAGQPWMSPTGMLQPKKVFMGIVPTILYNSRLRYHNHFTYILSTTDHLGGASFGYDGANDTLGENTPKTGNLFTLPDPCSGGDCKTNNEEVRILTNRRALQPFDIGAGGDNKPLIDAACKPAVREIVRGRGIRLFRIGHRQRYLWIWKRRYHLIEGWQTRTECDYVYNNVLCNPQPICPGACCCGSTCHMNSPGGCVGPNTRFAGMGTVCNAPGNRVTPCCFADYNQSGFVSVQDIFDFLGGLFTQNPCADVNISGTISVQDIFDFLEAYFAGCS